MSASQAQALSAIAFQLATALQAYEEEVAAMVAAPLDAEQYQRVSKRMDEMRMYATALPPLSVAWVEVLIRHFELTHGLWRAQQYRDATDLRALQARLAEAVFRLSRKCVQLMPSA
jgi:7-keto-8-aminopelargonate synthetase-like enzyme